MTSRLAPRLAALGVLPALALSACSDSGTDAAAETAPSEDVTVQTYFGGEVTVPGDPAEIVVLDFAALDTIDHLGLGERVVGVAAGATPMPDYLSSYADTAENVGDIFEPDFEAINALDPDLIIAGARSQPKVEELSDIAPTLDLTFEWGSEEFLESLETNTTAVGQIFGLETEVESILADLDAAAGEVAAAAADDGKGLVILTSAGEVSAYGLDAEDHLGRFDVVYEEMGVEPADTQGAIETHGDVVSFEYLADLDPDLLYVIDRDAAIGQEGESAQQVLDNDLVNGTSAAENGDIAYVDSAKWYLAFGGLTSYEAMIADVGSLVE